MGLDLGVWGGWMSLVIEMVMRIVMGMGMG